VAEPLISLGRWDEAADVIEHALELSPPPGVLASLLVLSGGLALARGDLAGAAQSAVASRDALARFGFRDQNHLPLARLETELHLAQDRPRDALETAEQMLDRINPPHSPRPAQPDQPRVPLMHLYLVRYALPLLAAGARACTAAFAAAARDDALAAWARRLLDRLNALADTMDAVGPLEEARRLAFAAEAARADAAGGVPGPDALAAWDAAAQAWEHLGDPYPLAHALLSAAEAALDRGDRDGAAQRLARVVPLADELGAAPLREQAASLARRARLSLPETRGEGEPFGLTARETEVLRLVAAGRSNRDIAAELFISAKTASVHVSNILAKLNVTSRTEAAAMAHRAGLTADDP
jgi:DNA-binding CsgD family transcriptional regulator